MTGMAALCWSPTLWSRKCFIFVCSLGLLQGTLLKFISTLTQLVFVATSLLKPAGTWIRPAQQTDSVWDKIAEKGKKAEMFTT